MSLKDKVLAHLMQQEGGSDLSKSVSESSGFPKIRIIDTTKKKPELTIHNGMTSYSDIIKSASDAGMDIGVVIARLETAIDGDGKILKADLTEILSH